MASSQLICNLSSCRKRLQNEVCVTSCSHIFCAEHLRSMTEKKNRNRCLCLACGAQLSNQLDLLYRHLKPSEQYKTTVLTGLNPYQIMEIANYAVNFVNYQLNYRDQNQEHLLRHQQDQLEELKHYCASLNTQYQAKLNQQQRANENLKRDLEVKMRELAQQQNHFEEYKRTNQKLKMEIEAYKREIANLRIGNLKKTTNFQNFSNRNQNHNNLNNPDQFVPVFKFKFAN